MSTIDNDYFSRATYTDVKKVCQSYHALNYVADVMNDEGYPTYKHDIDDSFCIHNINVTLTPAKHNWQNGSKKWQYRYWEEKDYCGYWFDTPDVILFDFADNDWHITLEGAIQLANNYSHSDLISIHSFFIF